MRTSAMNKKTKTVPRSARGEAAAAAAAAAVATGAKAPRTSRAEALVRHVTQLPSFLAWASTAAAAIAPAAPTSPAGVAEYLEARVKEVAAQLDSLQHAGDYTRLVVLLAELLQDEMALGVTPKMIEGGMLKLLRAAAAAVAQGEVGPYPAALPKRARGPTSAGIPATLETTALQQQQQQQQLLQSTRGNATTSSAFAAPIESLLPPLIDQTARATRTLADSVGGATNPAALAQVPTTEEAEMEAWENYMATVRVATTADAAAACTQVAMAPVPPAATASATSPSAPPASASGARVIDTLPAALCGLILSCTSAPFVVLVLYGQRIERRAVTDLARALVDIVHTLPRNATGEVAEVRLTAIQGLYHLLYLYVAKSNATSISVRDTGANGPSSTAPANFMLSKQAETASRTPVPTLVLDGAVLSQLLADVTVEWAQLISVLQSEKCRPFNGSKGLKDVADSSDEDAEDDAVAETATGATARGDGGDGAASELYWILEIAQQLLHAEQHVVQHQNSGNRRKNASEAALAEEKLSSSLMSLTISQLLPPNLLPVLLRTLSMLPNTPCLAPRSAMYARLCVDVLWTATLLAPVSASRQLLYGSLPDLAGYDGKSVSGSPNAAADARASPITAQASAHEAVDTPAVDFFLALLHQFNETHSLAHREMRDDLVTLLAKLLRYDVQFAEDELTRRRAAADAPSPPTAAGGAASSRAAGGFGQHPRSSHLSRTSSSSSHHFFEDAIEGDASLSGCTPLSLSVSTVEAINAIVALIFETTCGAELSAGSPINATNGSSASSGNGGSSRGGRGTARRAPQPDTAVEGRPSSLLSEDAVRSYALRFQSVSISAARRREVVDFKKYGWQLLEVHFGWQLAHLTFREYVNFHDTTAVSSAPPSAVAGNRLPEPRAAAAAAASTGVVVGVPSQPAPQFHQRSAPIHHVTGDDAGDEAVTAALWGMQLCRLGFFDVLLLYVDMDSAVPAVVTWTREELMLLEEEAWELFTSMILFTQHLDAAAGGIRVRRHRRYASPPMGLSQRGATLDGRIDSRGTMSRQISAASNAVSNESMGMEEDGFDDDDEAGGTLYGADMHFIAAGGVEVALRFLSAAPAEMEAVKRSALVTLAAIARTSSSGEAHLHAGSYTTKELAWVHRALTEHAPALVPFLVKIIREVDTHVDGTGTPAAVTALISSVVAADTAGATALAGGLRNPAEDLHSALLPARLPNATQATHTAARWGWLPQSASLTVVFAWCLLRCIGDVVLTEVGMMRELPEMTGDGVGHADGNGSEAGSGDENSDSGVNVNAAQRRGGKEREMSLMESSTHTATAQRSGTSPPPGKRMTATGVLFREQLTEAAQPYETAIEIDMADDDDLSSSGSSMGPPPMDAEEEKMAEQRWRQTAAAARPTKSTTKAGLSDASAMCKNNNSSERDNDVEAYGAMQQTNLSVGGETARRRTLLRSMHEEVLLIPELFASEGGIDLLTMWIRHTLRLCLPTPGEGSALMPSTHYAYQQPQHHAPHDRHAAVLRLPAAEVADLDRTSDLFLLLLDVFRAIVLGSEGNEELFVRSGGVHALLDLIEAFALAHGLIERAAQHARLLAINTSAVVYPGAGFAATTTSPAAAGAGETVATTSVSSGAALPMKEKKGVLLYAMTLLSDLLDNCPCALDELATWHSGHLVVSPLTPDVQECWSATQGIEAVQLLLCFWAADLPARNAGDNRVACFTSTNNSISNGEVQETGYATSNAGLELLRLHLRPALRMALKEEYVCRLLRQRAKTGALEAEAIRCYYRYIHAEATENNVGEGGSEDVTDAVVLAYMERLMSRHRKRNAVSSEQHIALLVNETLGLCLKVYGCLAAVGFDSLRAAETETAVSPSLHVHLSALERAFLVQIAALPALCVDEITTAMAEVALEDTFGDAAEVAKGVQPGVATWRPTTPDRRALSAAADAAAVRASELDQIIEVGTQVQQARGAQLYHRYLVTQLRQPVAPPADGRPGAVRGAWKTQRRLSATLGGSPATPAALLDTTMERPADYAVELAARLSTRLAAEEQTRQQGIAASVRLHKPSLMRTVEGSAALNREGFEEGERETSTRLMQTAPPALGSNRTPYTALMNSVHAAAAERQPASSFRVSSPPRRPAPPLTERLQKRQAMIARSVRKFPHEAAATVKDGRKL